MFEIVCLTICFVAFCWLCFSPPSSRLHQKVAMRQMIWRHWPAGGPPPSSLMMMFLFPTAGLLISFDFQGYLFFKFLQELVAEALSQDTERLEIDITLGAGAVDGRWWSLIGVDGLRLLRFLFMVEWSMSQPVLWYIWSEDWPLYLWVARVLDSFFMCWQYRFLTGWPKTFPSSRGFPRGHSILRCLF